MDFTKDYSTDQFQKLELNPSSIKMPPNHQDQGNDKELIMGSQFIMQVEQDQSQVKLDTDKEKNDCKKHRKFVIVGIFMILLIGGGLGLLFGLLNRNSIRINNTNYDSSNNISDPVEYFDLVKLNSTSALCLDGSPVSYYISRNGDSSKIMISFEGGAWCANKDYKKTIESCYHRSKGMMGSSNYHKSQMKEDKGIFSRDERNYFKDWKKVFLSYCDGMGHQGTRKQPIQFNGKLLYFRGHNNTAERLQSLQQTIGLFSNATQIVVGGQSAGGLASYLWVNYIAERAQKAKVFSIPSSGIFYDSFNHQSNIFQFREMLKSIVNITNQEIDPPTPECIQEYPSNKQNCHFAQYIYKYIKVPMFVVQSLYDSWCIPNVLGLKCTDAWGMQNLFNCNKTQMQLIEQYRATVFKLLQQISMKNNNGVWGLPCPGHNLVMNQRFYDAEYRIPKGSQNSISQAIKRWIQNTTSTNVYLGSTHQPENYACSGMK